MRLVAAAAAVAALVGCGSDESPSEPAPPAGSREAYIAEADAICEQANARRAPLQQQVEAAEPGDKKWIRLAEEDFGVARAMIERLEDLPRPEGDARELRTFYGLFTAAVDSAEGSVAYFRRTGDQQGTAARAEGALRFGDTAKRLAEEYGFEVCGQAPEKCPSLRSGGQRLGSTSIPSSPSIAGTYRFPYKRPSRFSS